MVAYRHDSDYRIPVNSDDGAGRIIDNRTSLAC